MSQTISSFLKHNADYGESNKSKLAEDIFNEYCLANNMKFRDITEEKRCLRFFWLGFTMIDKMQNQKKLEDEYANK